VDLEEDDDEICLDEDCSEIPAGVVPQSIKVTPNKLVKPLTVAEEEKVCESALSNPRNRKRQFTWDKSSLTLKMNSEARSAYFLQLG